MSKAEELGEVREAAVTGGTIRYRESGKGRPVVFVHGVLVNGDLWRGVVPRVAAAGFRCVTPDLPLGSHELPMESDADLTPPALAGLVVELIDRLGLEKPIVVGNDTGGALTQIAMANHGSKLGPVVLTSCDAFEDFFPPLFRYLSATARLPGSAFLLGQTLRLKMIERSPIAFGWLTRDPVPREYMRSYADPVRRSAGVRRDLTKVLRGVNRRHTLAAAERLPAFDQPVLLAWGDHDKVFPLEDARRLAQVLPDARIEVIEDSWAFVPEDQPERLAELIVAFAQQPARAPSEQPA